MLGTDFLYREGFNMDAHKSSLRVGASILEDLVFQFIDYV